MSVTNLDSLLVSDLTPDRFPVPNGSRVLVDGPIIRTYLQTPIVTGDDGGLFQGALVTGDFGGYFQGALVTGDIGGPYESPQIGSVQLTGVTGGNSENGALTWSIVSYGEDVTFEVYHGETLVASGTEEVPYFPIELALTQQNASGITGTVILLGGEESLNFSEQGLYIPLSISDALMAGDLGSGNIASVELQGVTMQNSYGGKLFWTYRHDTEGDGKLVFTLSTSNTEMAVASFDLAEEPSFPIELALEEQNASGISGTVVLADDDGVRGGSPEEGQLIVQAKRDPQIFRITLTGVDAGNSDDGLLSWSLTRAGETLTLEILAGETVIASGTSAEPEFPLELTLEEEGSSGVEGTVTLVSGYEATDSGSQWIHVPLSATAPLIAGDEEQENIESLTLTGFSLKNSDNGVLSWKYERVDTPANRLVFSLHNGPWQVATGHHTLEGEPSFPIEIDLEAVDGSELSGTVILANDTGVALNEAQEGRLVLKALRDVAQIETLSLSGVTAGNSDGGVLSWKLTSGANVTFELYDGVQLVGSASQAYPETFPVTMAITEENTSGIEGSVTLVSAHDVEDLGSQKVLMPISPSDCLFTGDDENDYVTSITLSGVNTANSQAGILSWTYTVQDNNDDHLTFTIRRNDSSVAWGEVLLTESPTFPYELALESIQDSGITGTVVLTQAMNPVDNLREGLLTIKTLSGLKFDNDLTVAGKVTTVGDVSIAGTADTGDIRLAWNLTMPNLATDETRTLYANGSGALIAAQAKAQPIFVQHSDIIVNPGDDYAISLFSVPLFSADGPATGSRHVPESWWATGKRLSLTLSFAWANTEYADIVVHVGFAGDQEYETLPLFDLTLPMGNVELLGEGVLEIELVAAVVEGYEDTLELRGYYRFNQETHALVLTGIPLMGYAFSPTVEFANLDAETNFLIMRTAAVTAYEVAPAQGLE